MTIFNRERAQDYSHFRSGCEVAPSGTFMFSRTVFALITRAIDKLEREALVNHIQVSKTDAMYEVEAHMFDMIRNANPNSEIEACIGLGKAMEEGTPETRGRVLGGLIRDRNFIAAANEEALGI